MSSASWREIVFLREEENDPRFRARIDRLSVIGLRGPGKGTTARIVLPVT